jgi:hypothetical protein
MSWNFNNSLSGGAKGNSLGSLSGNVNFGPTFSTSSGVNFTPSFGRAGSLTSFSTNTGVNYGGLEVSKNIGGGNGNGQLYVNTMVHQMVYLNFLLALALNFKCNNILIVNHSNILNILNI